MIKSYPSRSTLRKSTSKSSSSKDKSTTSRNLLSSDDPKLMGSVLHDRSRRLLLRLPALYVMSSCFFSKNGHVLLFLSQHEDEQGCAECK